MLGYEHRVAAHRGLPAIIGNRGRCKAPGYEVFGMASYRLQTFIFYILYVGLFQGESAAKVLTRQAVEQFVKITAYMFFFARDVSVSLISEEVAFFHHSGMNLVILFFILFHFHMYMFHVSRS